MNPISAICNVYNEAEYIAEAFRLIRPYVDDFVVADQGSTDDTVEIASEFTDKIVRFPRVYYGYAYIHQAALLATHRWVMKIDPDERYDAEILDNLGRCIAQDADMVKFRIEYGGDSKSLVTRLWKKDRIIWTDSFDAVLCEMPGRTFSEYVWDHGKIVNLRSRESVPERYRIEGAKRLLARYGDTNVEPYNNYAAYYSMIVNGETV
jgi:glycosyltransferase involved in cell wall biosynthesis